MSIFNSTVLTPAQHRINQVFGLNADRGVHQASFKFEGKPPAGWDEAIKALKEAGWTVKSHESEASLRRGDKNSEKSVHVQVDIIG